MTTMSRSIHNFCAGPCVLPDEVLAELADELPNFDATGMSLIEMSHRSGDYDKVHHETLDLLRQLTSAPDDFSIMFIQGGASLQFAMLPMNVLPADRTAGYVVSGTWGKKALADAEKLGSAYSAWDGADGGYARMPTVDELDIKPGTSFLHVTSNETIGGIRMAEFADPGIPMLADMSSDYLSRPIPWDRFAVVYGGVQKNLGPAGMAVVFARTELLDSIPSGVPAYLSYNTHHKGDSLANTPPMFTIWATNKMLKWIKANGGLEAMDARSERRSGVIYDAIDSSNGFYRSPVDAASRSRMNIVFRLADEDLEAAFLTEADANGMKNLKGHRSVGGIRASVYNALPDASVDALAQFMSDFAASHG